MSRSGIKLLHLGALLLLSVAWPAAAEQPPSFVVETGVRQLFLDDVAIEKTEGMTRTLHQPKRFEGNPVIRPDQPWEQYCAHYGTVLFDPSLGKLRLWYLTLPRDRGLKLLEMEDGHQRAPHTTLLGYAESEDGVQWTKPNLGQFSYDGSKDNNIVKLGVDNCEGAGILIDPRDPDPARRYKCLYWDHGSGGYEVKDGRPFSKDGPNDGQYAAVSPDGLHWTPLANNPIHRRYCDTQQVLLFDPRLERYVSFSRFGQGRVSPRSESSDFEYWSEPEVVLRCDDADGPGAQIYGAGIEIYEGVYFAMLWIYHEGTDATIDTQLATSRDGIHWTRVADRALWLPLGDVDSWEGGMVRSMARLIPRGDELAIYYSGVHGPHNRPGHPPVERKHRVALGLVTQRRDGFVSLDAGENPGTLLTKPFALPAGSLHLNVDASAGEVAVTICDAEGTPLSEQFVSRPITGDQLNVPFEFGGQELEGQTVRLRFTLRQASLYSYWFAAEN